MFPPLEVERLATEAGAANAAEAEASVSQPAAGGFGFEEGSLVVRKGQALLGLRLEVKP